MADDPSSQVNSMGKKMTLVAWVVLLLLLTLFFNDVLEKQFNPNQDLAGRVTGEGAREVTLQRNRQGHYVATGKINGHPVAFLVDTGATDVALSEDLADKLGLARLGGSFSQTANGVVAVWQANLDTVELGTIQLNNVRSAIMPSMPGDDQVLLGMSFLKTLDFQQQDDKLTLRQLPGR